MRLNRARVAFAALSAVLMVGLSACYLPNHFMAEVRIGRTGDYGMMYEGELIYAPLVEDIRTGKVPPDKVNEKEDAIERDLQRDSGFYKIVRAINPATWIVRYEREGRLGKTDLVTFVRRNSRILTIKAAENGVVAIVASTISPNDAQRLGDIGLSMSGEFRVTTDAEVLKHNAAEIRPYGPYKVYIWKIENALSPTPQIVLKREMPQ